MHRLFHYSRQTLLMMLGVTSSLIYPGFCLADTALTGRQIMDEVSRRHDVDSRFEVNEMVLVDRSGEETRRKMRSYLKIQKDRLSKSLLIFDAPKGITGVACLTWEREGSSDDQWTFLPAMGNRLKRISSGKKSGDDDEDSYNSAEYVRTKEDLDFIDTEGDDADAVAELYAEQNFEDEREAMEEPDTKKKKKV